MTKRKNKTAIITGGSSGIGLAIAKGFTESCINTVIVSRNKDGGEKARGEITKKGSSCISYIQATSVPLIIE